MNVFELPFEQLKKAAKHIKQESSHFGKALQKLPEATHPAVDPAFARPIEVWRSCDFLVQIFDGVGMERISVNRTVIDTTNRRWRDGITWDDLQEIKRQVGRGDKDAVEIFPAEKDVVNVANMRHLFVFKDEELSFKWKPESAPLRTPETDSRPTEFGTPKATEVASIEEKAKEPIPENT
jgi:hypothetical protein